MSFTYSSKLFGGIGAGGSGVGTSLTTQVLFNASGAVAGDAGLTYDAATDTLTTGRVLVGDGSAGITTGGANVLRAYTSAGGYAQVSGNAFETQTGNTLANDSIVLSAANPVKWWTGAAYSSAVSGTSAASTIRIGLADSATPVANTLIVGESGSGTDIAGGNGVIQSGAGTGSGAGSTLALKTPAAHGSDAVAQTQVTRMVLSSTGVNIPNLATYADNAAALTGGLVAGDLYRTGADPDPVMIVH